MATNANSWTLRGKHPVWSLDGGNDYVPLAVVESNARQQFVHLHLWTAGLVTITGPGKKTLQSHYNNDSNSGQERRSLCRPPLLLLFLSLFPFPTCTLTFHLSFCINFSFCPPWKLTFQIIFVSLWVSLLCSAIMYTYWMTLFINALLWLEFIGA